MKMESSYSNVVHLSLAAVTTGLSLALTLWALGDIIGRRKSTRTSVIKRALFYIPGIFISITIKFQNLLTVGQYRLEIN